MIDIDEYTLLIHKGCGMPVQVCSCPDWPVKQIGEDLFIIDGTQITLKEIPK